MYQFHGFLRCLRHMPDGTVLRTHEVFVHRLPEHIEQRLIVLQIGDRHAGDDGQRA